MWIAIAGILVGEKFLLSDLYYFFYKIGISRHQMIS